MLKTPVISIFDTTIAEFNLGNQIIMEAINNEIDYLFNDYFYYRLPYQQVGSTLRHCIEESDYVFFGGTNSLSSFMNKFKQWDINLLKTRYVKNVIMVGIGWWQYQDFPNLYTRAILSRALSHDYIHSARDSYTADRLSKLGFKVLNTGCPTTWCLNDSCISSINRKAKASSVVVTLTDYNPDRTLDKILLKICFNLYESVYFWPQGAGDLNYIQTFNEYYPRMHILKSSLRAYDEIFDRTDIEYVGTRLHSGIRALQNKSRAHIVAIDNRATEIAKDINLPVIKRREIEKLSAAIVSPYHLSLHIHWDEIDQWRSQFKSTLFMS